jgi:hypothetical protein
MKRLVVSGRYQIDPKGADFFGPQMAFAYPLDAISRGPKKYRYPGPNPLPLALVMDASHGSANTKSIGLGLNILSEC